MSDTPWETIKVERHGGVGVVSLMNPPVNAVSRKMVKELSSVIDELEADEELRALVIAADGVRAFSAGVDLKELQEIGEADPDALAKVKLESGIAWRRFQERVRHLPVPVIAAVEAVAIGAGFGLVGVVDIIIASERATFGLTEINVGLLGGASKALRMVGPFKARRMFFTGELVSADEMHQLGVVEEVVPAGGALDRALELAQVIATKSPIAMRLAKESIVRMEGHWLEDSYRMEQDYTNRLGQYSESAEALQNSLSKKDPSSDD